MYNGKDVARRRRKEEATDTRCRPMAGMRRARTYRVKTHQYVAARTAGGDLPVAPDAEVVT
jgi:hypothetical protein